MTVEKMASQMIERYGLSKGQAKIFLKRIENELGDIAKDYRVSTMRTWAIQIKNKNLYEYERLSRMIEHLITRRDIEGLTILIPGLSREVAQKYIEADVRDYQMRAARLSQPNVNPATVNNGDLELAHQKRMLELITGRFEKTEEVVQKKGM